MDYDLQTTLDDLLEAHDASGENEAEKNRSKIQLCLREAGLLAEETGDFSRGIISDGIDNQGKYRPITACLEGSSAVLILAWLL